MFKEQLQQPRQFAGLQETKSHNNEVHTRNAAYFAVLVDLNKPKRNQPQQSVTKVVAPTCSTLACPYKDAGCEHSQRKGSQCMEQPMQSTLDEG